MEHSIRETMETELHPSNMIREEGFLPSKSVLEAAPANTERMQEGPLLQGKVNYST
jgi:hypothetical protein